MENLKEYKKGVIPKGKYIAKVVCGDSHLLTVELKSDKTRIILEFGMAYNLYGIELMFGFDDNNDVCYIAAGQNLISIDIKNKEILFNPNYSRNILWNIVIKPQAWN